MNNNKQYTNEYKCAQNNFKQNDFHKKRNYKSKCHIKLDLTKETDIVLNSTAANTPQSKIQYEFYTLSNFKIQVLGSTLVNNIDDRLTLNSKYAAAKVLGEPRQDDLPQPINLL